MRLLQKNLDSQVRTHLKLRLAHKYLFVGKSQPWTSEGAATDSLPPHQLIVLRQIILLG